jgi:hypothetical protein
MNSSQPMHAPTPAATTDDVVPVGHGDDERALVGFLRQRDVACPLCEYNLRGLTSARCPECGRELRLSVGLTEPFMRAWILLAAAAFGSGGSGVFLLFLVMRSGWPRDSGSLRAFVINVCLTYLIASIPLAVLVPPTRRRFLRLPQGRQWALAWGLVFVSSAAMVLFAAFVR